MSSESLPRVPGPAHHFRAKALQVQTVFATGPAMTVIHQTEKPCTSHLRNA